MKLQAAPVYEFEDFRLDLGARLLVRRDGTPVALTPRVFDTLVFLVENHGTVLDKERLMEAVWPDSIVEENNLAQAISKLRQVFGEKPGAQRFIVTVPGRGYRFAADVVTCHGAIEPAEDSVKESEVQADETALRAGDAVLESKLARVGWLTRGVIGLLLVVALGLGALLFPSRPQRVASSGIVSALPQKSIAVLPFENLSSDAANAYFADGVQDEILTYLAKVADLKVISRMSVMPYKGKSARDLSQIARQLGVTHLLEGSVQRSGNRVRVNVQLIATGTGSHEWAETYDRDLADVFLIQSEIAQAIALQLQAKISPEEKAAIALAPTSDLIANSLYHEAVALDATGFESSYLQGVVLAERAVARDPQFALAYCVLARLHLGIFSGGVDHTPARLARADAAIQKALRLQPQSGEVHLALTRYAYYGFRDYDRARAELEIARRVLPNNAELYFLSALLDRRQGRWNEASRNAARAVELDPRNCQYLLLAAGIDYALQRIPDAHAMIDRACSVDPRDITARVMRAQEAFAERANPRPLKRELSAILAEQPEAAAKIFIELLRCALADRDPAAAARALGAISADGSEQSAYVYPREWFVGLVARTFNDPTTARTSFTAARAKVEKQVREQPDFAQAWSMLGRIDAALGHKDDAIREIRRACELVPVSKDAVDGAFFLTDLALIYAWVGEKDLAIEQLQASPRIPNGVNYGRLLLEPQWDSLRGDPRFEKLVASLGPAAAR